MPSRDESGRASGDRSGGGNAGSTTVACSGQSGRTMEELTAHDKTSWIMLVPWVGDHVPLSAEITHLR